MRLLKTTTEALVKINSGEITSVEELPSEIKWDLWENGLIKDKNKITVHGKFVLKQISENNG